MPLYVWREEGPLVCPHCGSGDLRPIQDDGCERAWCECCERRHSIDALDKGPARQTERRTVWY